MNGFAQLLPPRRLRGARTLAVLAAAVLPAWAAAQVNLDQQPIAWTAPLEFSTYALSSGNAVAFRGDFIRSTWDGDLVAHNVAASGAFSVRWRAREQMPAWDQRRMFTLGLDGVGVCFRYDGSCAMSETHVDQLGGDDGGLLLNWIRGDASKEYSPSAATNPYRPRYSKVAAIIRSRPFYDGSTVYVGSNGGMVHAFDAATGAERWAYVPRMLIASGRFQRLADPWATSLPYMVDGQFAHGTVGSAKMLFGGLGAGGRGLFALDVTTQPTAETTSAAQALAKWEVTHESSGYANLGHVMSAPQLVTLQDGTRALLVPNGVNGTGGGSSLFVVRASDGARLAEIAAGSGPNNALGAVAAVDRNGDGRVDVAYAGDLRGTLWKFDLSGGALPSAATALFTPDPLQARPVTAAPSVTVHPRGGLMVNFGTGALYTAADQASITAEYLYGIWDSPLATATTLVEQTLTSHTVGSVQARTASANAVNYAAGARGWRIALAGGERLVGTDTLTDNGRFVVTTTVPSGTGQGGWLMQIQALTGGAPGAPFFDLNGDGTISSNDNSDRIVSGGSALVPVGKFLGSGAWSQPVLAQVSSALDLPMLNYNPNVALPGFTTTVTTPPPPPGESGIFGGHFDFDIFYNCGNKLPTKGNCTNNHVHEYDDRFDVVGVNMLNASNAAFNLSNPIPSLTTPSFKILVANTRWSPAAALLVGGVVQGKGWQLPVSPEGFLAATPGGAALTFTRQSLSQFIFVLPRNAFTNKDWGTGQVRAGLIPTQTGCIQANANPTTNWMDGAFTIQVVNASANASHVLALGEGAGAAGGHRLSDDATSRALLVAQYTAFWHHPNGKCMLQSGWTMAPAADTSAPGKASKPAAGSDDPKGSFYSGVFGNAAGGVGAVEIKHFVGGVEVLVARSFDANGIRQVLTNKANGTVLSDARSDFGTAQRTDLQRAERARLGRLGWKEIVR